jgi:predicted PurR-regulated permease PerM
MRLVQSQYTRVMLGLATQEHKTEMARNGDVKDAGTATVPPPDDARAVIPSGPEPVVLQMPVDVRSVALSILAGAATIMLLRYMQDVFIPLVLGGLLFYALDPFVDWLQRLKVPRAVAAATALLLLVSAASGIAYAVRFQAIAVVEQMPNAAQRFREALRVQRGTFGKMQDAAKEIEKTADSVAGNDTPRGVTKVQIVEPAFAARAYLWAGSINALSIAGQAVMVLLLTFFLLLSDDLFKRKLVEGVPTFARKKLTVQVLDQIADQIERFLLVQLFTSLVVGMITWAALWAIGLQQAAVWGLAAGVFNTIPYFGPVIVTGGLGIVAFLQFGTFTMALAVAGIALAITSLEGWFLTPMLLSRAANMNQVAVFVGLIFWSWIWGVWGMLLAVPMLMVVKSVCDHIEDLQPVGQFLGE